jgi:hypothetical protein
MAIEIVDFPIENGGSFHSYVKLPEGKGRYIHSSFFLGVDICTIFTVRYIYLICSRFLMVL